VKSSCCYAHRVTVQVAQRGPSLRPGLTPDPTKQKYTQTVVSTRIVPRCVLFLGRKNVFTQSGSDSVAKLFCSTFEATLIDGCRLQAECFGIRGIQPAPARHPASYGWGPVGPRLATNCRSRPDRCRHVQPANTNPSAHEV
jgi:hypothetical protein